jgi:ferredoxin
MLKCYEVIINKMLKNKAKSIMPIVSFADSDKEFTVESHEILYNALEEQGECLPHGCLSGSCGACRIVVLEGNTNLSEPKTIEQDTIDSLTGEYEAREGKDFLDGKQIRLSCRARVLGDIKIKVLE